MKIIDLTTTHEKYIQQAAQLLMSSFENCWNTRTEAVEEVEESIGKDRISRIAIDDQGDLVGWIAGNKQYDGNVWELHPLVVHKDWRGKGVGKLLTLDFEKQVAKEGGLTILLGTDDESNSTSLGGIDIYPDIHQQMQNIQNKNNHPFEFYQKLGYTVVGVVPDANGFGKPDILMAKRVQRIDG